MLNEKPKKKKSELMKDLLEHAKNKNSNDYAEDFAEMETSFKTSPIEINNDLRILSPRLVKTKSYL